MGIKILSPLSKPEEVEALIDAGADELYCGVLPDEWRQRYTVAASLNRRQEDNPVLCTSPHLKSFEELEASTKKAHVKGVPVIVTINEHYYSKNQYPYLTRYIERLLHTGIDAFIVGDLGLILTLQEMESPASIHISTAGTAFNAETVHFYRDIGASRVILPRHLSLKEIEQIALKTSGIELEAFILNSRCGNVDGFCTFQHGLVDLIEDANPRKLFENACMLPYEVSAAVDGCEQGDTEKILKEKVSWERQHIWTALHIDDRPCGVCALYEFSQVGLAGVKIVGRQNALKKKVKDVTFLRELLQFLRNDKPTREIFRDYARRLYREMYKFPCLIFKCYYPDVLYENSC